MLPTPPFCSCLLVGWGALVCLFLVLIQESESWLLSSSYNLSELWLRPLYCQTEWMLSWLDCCWTHGQVGIAIVVVVVVVTNYARHTNFSWRCGAAQALWSSVNCIASSDAGHGVAGFCFPCLVLLLFSSFFAVPPLFSYGMEWFVLCRGTAEIRNVFSTL